jgi:hypothetical protein
MGCLLYKISDSQYWEPDLKKKQSLSDIDQPPDYWIHKVKLRV